MSDIWSQDKLPSVGDQSHQLLLALQQYAPQAIQAIAGTLPSTTGAQLSAQQGVEPGYEQLYNQNQVAAGQTEANVAAGPGQQLVSLADKYQQQLDPQYYAQRGNLSDALTKYLGSYDPTKLSPTEVAQISRGINATTGPVTPSNLNTIKNAQTFGAAGTQRWQNFGDAITKAASTLPQLRSGISGFNTATSRGSNTGAQSATNNATGANFGFSTTALNDITGAANTILQKTPIKDAYDKALAMSQTFSNIASGAKGMGGGGGAGAGGA